ncbi:acetyltransferase [Paracoccus halophilus]|uniref:Acetyltransferase n=1 Tax=Paracoccus halophilus TaxID=376733 RepID=A0A099F3P9_9RHOB|nr:acetyltransferase [Paracoccus halophilus]
MPADAEFARAFETTWPASEYADAGAFRVGRGLGAGGRVGSARAIRPDWRDADIAAAEARHRDWGQRPMFRLSDSDTDLAAALARQGYLRETPVAIMAADCAALSLREVPGMTVFDLWPPLAIQRDIWAAGGIDAARQAVMARVALPRTALLARIDDRAAGTAFAAADGTVAMVHAIEIVAAFRRRGLAGWLLRKAAQWALGHGATRLGLAVARDNIAARALYDRMGFAERGGYSYWARD